MTHTLNRTGLDDTKPGEEFVILCMAHYKDKAARSKQMEEMARVIIDHRPINFIGHPLGIKEDDLAPLAGLTGIITAVYTNKDLVIRLVKEIKSRKLGISVVLSGLFSDIGDVCRATGLTEHTSHIALGVFGKTEKIADPLTMEITTQCGHALVSRQYVKDIVKRLQKGKLTAAEGSELLAKPCVCGILNPKRTETILTKMAQRT